MILAMYKAVTLSAKVKIKKPNRTTILRKTFVILRPKICINGGTTRNPMKPENPCTAAENTKATFNLLCDVLDMIILHKNFVIIIFNMLKMIICPCVSLF